MFRGKYESGKEDERLQHDNAAAGRTFLRSILNITQSPGCPKPFRHGLSMAGQLRPVRFKLKNEIQMQNLPFCDLQRLFKAQYAATMLLLGVPSGLRSGMG